MNYQPRRKKAVPTTIAGVLALLIGTAVTYWKKSSNPAPDRSPPRVSAPANPTPTVQNTSQSPRTNSKIGWTSRASLDSHFRKHGAEMGIADINDYLKRAQALRDTPTGGPVSEIVRTDGVITRFNRLSGEFIAVNPDQTIRTFFKPADGYSYFKRQAERERDDD